MHGYCLTFSVFKSSSKQINRDSKEERTLPLGGTGSAWATRCVSSEGSWAPVSLFYNTQMTPGHLSHGAALRMKRNSTRKALGQIQHLNTMESYDCFQGDAVLTLKTKTFTLIHCQSRSKFRNGLLVSQRRKPLYVVFFSSETYSCLCAFSSKDANLSHSQ